MIVKDIVLTYQFLDDYELLPNRVKKTLDNKIIKILDSGSIINSLNAHKADHCEEPIWIGHLKKGKGGYRVLFEVDTKATAYLLRALNHDDMEKYLRQIIKNQ